MSVDGAGLRVLTEQECRRLLGTVTLGRVALSHRALPLILPVHFRIIEDRIVIHTAPGTSLHQATDDAVVAFEAEGPPGVAEPSWSVVVHGVATHPVAPSPSGATTSGRIEISTDQLSGREVLDQPRTFASSSDDHPGQMLGT